MKAPRFPSLILCNLFASVLLLPLAGCSGSDGDAGPQGPAGPAGPPGGSASTNSALDQGDSLPGIHVGITALGGGSGAGGSFQVGDHISITFTLTKDGGSAWDLDEMHEGRALVAGPSSNYQRVLPEVSDVAASSVDNGDGTYTYTFVDPIPPTYVEPYNNTESFGAEDGELTGEELASGTYTLGLYFTWDYTVSGTEHRDAGNATRDFLFGSATTLDEREVVKQDNCNQCHESLRAHGGMRREVKLCLLCHTAGAEDKNGTMAGGTPGASVDFKVMIHKIHAGEHLPSVLGIGTNPDGSRNYAAPPEPYELVGYGDSINDFSEVAFPVMPSAYAAFTYDSTGVNYTGAFGNGPMPRDTGYAVLPLAHKRLEDLVRTGPVACDKCHGDPDGSGPLTAPAQGDQYKSRPTEAACGSCHDDVVWGHPYTANGQMMPSTASNANCALCHEASGNSLAVENAHLHPYLDPSFNSGVNIDITAVGGGSLPGGNHQSGDPIQVTYSVKDDAGTDLAINSLTRFQMIVSGPSSNQQWILPNVNPFDFAFRKSSPFTGSGSASTPSVSAGAVKQTIAVVFTSGTTFDVQGSVSTSSTGLVIGAGSGSTANVSYNGVSFTLTQGATQFVANDRFYFEVVPVASSYPSYVPRDVNFELLGNASGLAQTLAFGNVPAYWGRQVIYERTALVGSSTVLTDAALQHGRYVACDAGGLALAVGDRVVLDAGTASEEYVQVGRVQTTDDISGVDLGSADRVWFTVGLRFAHSAGSTIQECTLSTRREGSAYTMATSGATSIDLVAGQFTLGNPVIASYRTHGRFGFRNSPGGSWLSVFGPFATADTDDIEISWGDWKGLSIVDGTYRVGMWANRDFTLTPLRAQTTTETFNTIASDNTTYRMMAPPATKDFLFGAAMEIEERTIIPSGQNCNRCHGDIAAHGFGRRGLDTCMLCHATPGAEDGAKYSYASWYIGSTPGVSVDFRTMLHKIHMGKELTNASTYAVNGVFLGTAYPVHYDEVGFPVSPGGVSNCAICHGAENAAWKAPAEREHPSSSSGVREWRAVCGSCHDASAVAAHIDINTTATGAESCSVCHGAGGEWSVERVHKTY